MCTRTVWTIEKLYIYRADQVVNFIKLGGKGSVVYITASRRTVQAGLDAGGIYIRDSLLKT